MQYSTITNKKGIQVMTTREMQPISPTGLIGPPRVVPMVST